jgi:hypothetical protein
MSIPVATGVTIFLPSIATVLGLTVFAIATTGWVIEPVH